MIEIMGVFWQELIIALLGALLGAVVTVSVFVIQLRNDRQKRKEDLIYEFDKIHEMQKNEHYKLKLESIINNRPHLLLMTATPDKTPIHRLEVIAVEKESGAEMAGEQVVFSLRLYNAGNGPALKILVDNDDRNNDKYTVGGFYDRSIKEIVNRMGDEIYHTVSTGLPSGMYLNLDIELRYQNDMFSLPKNKDGVNRFNKITTNLVYYDLYGNRLVQPFTIDIKSKK